MPLAGTILSVITVYLVISYFQLWKTNGIIWRAGLICALMKSISPSSIILGPMVGILSEALLLELAIRTLGKNGLAYAIGGALAVFSALLQKAMTFLILYGWDIVALLKNMYYFAVKQLSLGDIPITQALGLISAIYIVSGAVAALAGYKAGKSFTNNSHHTITPSFTVPALSSLFKHSKKQNYSVAALILIFILLVSGMLVIAYSGIICSAVFTLVFASTMYVRYKGNMRVIKKPAFWIQITAILLFSAIFFDGISIQNVFRKEGWIIGIEMIFRALVLISAFSGISIELKNPVIKNILYKRGLKNLYQSLEMAFSALPGLTEAFSAKKNSILGFRKLTHTMLESSRSLLERFSEAEKNRRDIFILTGDVDEGKTATARRIVDRLKDSGMNIQGLLSTKNRDYPGKHDYHIKDIVSGEKALLCSQSSAQGSIKTGRFYFSEEGLTFGRNILLQSLDHPTDLIVIDELGPLELKDKGWTPAIEQLLTKSKVPHLWIVREKLVNIIMRKWHIGDVRVFNIKEDSVEVIIEEIQRQLRTTEP
jgi:nucleoside-triphosphatase THEP1